MIELTNTQVLGFEDAIRGMRNPLNSWDKSDSSYEAVDYSATQEMDIYDFVIGPNDLDLMRRLRNSGTDHRKFMRMIVVYVDILAPLYWWKEFDTYKVGTVANSCSTMHTIHKKPFDISDFSSEHLLGFYEDENFNPVCDLSIPIGYPSNEMCPRDILNETIVMLNAARRKYLETKDKKYWWQMIQLLPSSYNQKRTVMLNYEVLANIFAARCNHKLDEWYDFCYWIRELKLSALITGEFDDIR